MMTENKIKTRNSSIDIFRYICAILVVAIHTKPLGEFSELLQNIVIVIARVGVPFFFAVAGYFYIQKLEKGQKPFWGYLKKLLGTYTLWSLFYFAIGFLTSRPASIIKYLADCAVDFAINGSCYHFWFFPALIFAVSLTTLLYRLKWQKVIIPLAVALYAVGCLGCTYYELGLRIPLLGELIASSAFKVIRRFLMQGFGYFACGYIVHRLQEKAQYIYIKQKPCRAWLSAVVLWLTEVAVAAAMGWLDNAAMTVGLYLVIAVTLLILLENPLPRFGAVSNKCRVLANFTYYVHPFCIMCWTTVWEILFDGAMPQTLLFVLTAGTACLGGLLIHKCNNKYVNYLVN